ncbi:hypothetical protein BHE74_00041958 [Ensete ventricosum]|nr:hypothetical protein BHE74_00041958 [Ensete ventricosum]
MRRDLPPRHHGSRYHLHAPAVSLHVNTNNHRGAGSSFSQKDALALSLPPSVPSSPLPLHRRWLPLPIGSRPYGQRRARRRRLYGLATSRRCPCGLTAGKQHLAGWPLATGDASVRRWPSYRHRARSQSPAYGLLPLPMVVVSCPLAGDRAMPGCPSSSLPSL